MSPTLPKTPPRVPVTGSLRAVPLQPELPRPPAEAAEAEAPTVVDGEPLG